MVGAGLFAVPAHYREVYVAEHGHRCAGVVYGGPGNQLVANLIAVGAIGLWSAVLNLLLFATLRALRVLRALCGACESASVHHIMIRRQMLRVTPLSEKAGLDIYLHNEDDTRLGVERNDMDITRVTHRLVYSSAAERDDAFGDQPGLLTRLPPFEIAAPLRPMD
jgi:ammonia channel protein AmtB